MSLRGRFLARCLALTLLVLTPLTACGPAPGGSTHTFSGGSPPPATTTPAASGSASIPGAALNGTTIEAWYPWFGVEASLFESQVTEFNRTNTWGISVQATSQNSYTELYSNVTSALPTPDRPQIVIGLPEYELGWDAGGDVVDLTGYVNDPENGLAANDVRDFPPVFWSQDVAGGRRFGVPAERGARFLIYNSSWARGLGFDAAPRTADEFRQQACRAHQSMSSDQDKSNDGQGGWLVDTNPMTFLSWTMAFGGGVLEGGGYRFLTPKNLAALTYVKQLYDDGCSWSATPGQDAPTAFANRTALFATAGIEELPEYSRAMAAADNADEWTVLSFPGPDQSGLAIYGSSYVLLKSTPQMQLASWLFVRWLLSPENQSKWVETTGLFPLRTSSLGLLDGYKKSHPQWSSALDLLPAGQILPQLASWREVRTMVGDGFSVMFRSNTPSGRVAEILAIMERTAADLSQ